MFRFTFNFVKNDTNRKNLKEYDTIRSFVFVFFRFYEWSLYYKDDLRPHDIYIDGKFSSRRVHQYHTRPSSAHWAEVGHWSARQDPSFLDTI